MVMAKAATRFNLDERKADTMNKPPLRVAKTAWIAGISMVVALAGCGDDETSSPAEATGGIGGERVDGSSGSGGDSGTDAGGSGGVAGSQTGGAGGTGARQRVSSRTRSTRTSTVIMCRCGPTPVPAGSTSPRTMGRRAAYRARCLR